MIVVVRPALRVALPVLLLVTVLGCTVGPGGVAVTTPRPTDPPVASAPVDGGGVSGGSSGGAPGTGPTASDGSGLLEPGSPTLVVANPGRLQPHRVGASSVDARVIGGRVVARLTWWSGVAPCSVLDSVRDERSGRQVRLTIVEGADRLDVACIEIAMLKATDVDLGVLAPGTWTIDAYGEAPPVTITVP